MNSHIPFAVVGSTEFVRVGNKMMRSRQYPWGTVQGTITLSYYALVELILHIVINVFMAPSS